MKKALVYCAIFLSYFINTARAQITQLSNEQATVPYISILQTEPEQPIEGNLVFIYFRFYNPTNETINGWIGADINSGTGPPHSSPIDWPVKDLGSGQAVDGAIVVRATDAGIKKQLRVFYYETQEKSSNQGIIKSRPEYEIAITDLDIAALINFRLNSFTINHTRAPNEDTNFGSLFASLDGVPVMEPVSVFMGDFADGTYPFGGRDANRNVLPYLESGPIAMVPGRNSTLHIAYTIYNGGGVANYYNFLRGYAEATANPELFKGPRPGSDTAIEVLKKLFLPLSAIGACDGLVAFDTITIYSNDIFENPNSFTRYFNKKFNTEEYASQTGCGKTSDYTVTSSLFRGVSDMNGMLIAAREYQNKSSASIDGFPVYINIHDKRKLGINPQNTALKWNRLESIDEYGDFKTVNDPAYGYISGSIYYAPSEIKEPTLVILRGNVNSYAQGPSNDANGSSNKEGWALSTPLSQNQAIPATSEYSLNNLNKGELKQITAIVQLVPGLETMTTIIPEVDGNDNSEITAVTSVIIGGQSEVPPGDASNDQGDGNSQISTDAVLINDQQGNQIMNTTGIISISGEWNYRITSASGSIFTGKVYLVQNGESITGNLVLEGNQTPLLGTYSDDGLALTRDTGLQTTQIYDLKSSGTNTFGGTYFNQGKYADSGSVEFYR